MPTKAVGRWQLCPSLRGTHQPSAKWLCTISLPLAQAMWTAAWSNRLMDVAKHPRSDCWLCLSQQPRDQQHLLLQSEVVAPCSAQSSSPVTATLGERFLIMPSYSCTLSSSKCSSAQVCDSKKATLSKKLLGCLWLSVAPIHRQVRNLHRQNVRTIREK